MSKVDDFLRHMRARDLPDRELFALKAEAFDEMAAVERDELHRDTMRAIAAESRARARGFPKAPEGWDHDGARSGSSAAPAAEKAGPCDGATP